MRRHLLFFGVIGILVFFVAIASRDGSVASRAMISTSSASSSETLLPDVRPRAARAPASIDIEPVNGNE